MTFHLNQTARAKPGAGMGEIAFYRIAKNPCLDFRVGIYTPGNLAQQALGFASGLVWGELAMPADCVVALASANPITNEIEGRTQLTAHPKPNQALVPYKGVRR
jgi:hypothetical protein